ncbi:MULTISPECIES: hypothetical protein [Galbibacter]|uniref:Uncharacterized protein n=1 Tax=Galbibacter pacificus TaxID=2996052 RepID=A0ABT6FPV8_9FLAO|nr:hypothetical protein [Galbibacter pacificus]MDG3582227.1 hypothetical protein [Galbibacter pacificus]MDG3585297.1 hypothetical protein [Galbibacter pacificus]
MVSYQIITTLNVEVTAIDENEIFRAFPVLLILTSFLLWVSFKIRNFTKVEDLKRRIKVEIFNIVALLGKNKTDQHEDVKNQLNMLIRDKKKYSSEEYLKRLEELKGKLMK